MKNKEPTVGIIMGSKSDWKDVMEHCSEMLKEFGVKHDVRVISAHRTPKRLERFISEAEKNNYDVIIYKSATRHRLQKHTWSCHNNYV